MNRQALEAYFAEVVSEPSELGGLDCVRFVIEAIRVGWGQDFRGCLRYSCRRSAVTQLRQDGGLYDAFAAVLGEAVPRSELLPGDIAYFPDSFVGLMLPESIAVKYRRTIHRVPFERCAQGFQWDRH